MTQDRRATPRLAGWPGIAVAGFLLALGIAVIVTGAWLWRSTAGDAGTMPQVTAESPASTGPPTAGPPRSHRAAPFPPARVRVPRAGVDAAVVPVTVQPDGLLTVPADVHTVGWWSAGAAAGARSGSVILVGHVDSARQGPGAFFAARTLRPGDRVLLAGAGGRAVEYTVAARRQYPKSALPAGEVFSQGTRPRLVLVTCGGTFDSQTHRYSDNVVVYALPVSSSAAAAPHQLSMHGTEEHGPAHGPPLRRATPWPAARRRVVSRAWVPQRRARTVCVPARGGGTRGRASCPAWR